MQPEELISLMLGLAMVAGVTIIFMGLRQRSHRLELLHRERMAMIERGLVPPPEMQGYRYHDRPAPTRGRALTAGIVIVALGLGLMTLIGVAAGDPEVAIGLGGAIAIVGAAFIAISIVTGRTQGAAPAHQPPPPPDLPA